MLSMRHVCLVLLVSSCSLLAQDQPPPADVHTWLGRGIQEFKAARYSDAVDDFQKSVQLDPSNVNAHLYLATSYLMQYVPGSQNSENVAIAEKARAEFKQVLKLHADDQRAIYYLAFLDYQEAGGITDLDEKNRHLDSARSGYLKLLAAEPQNKEILYTLAVIDWMQWYPHWKSALDKAGIKPDEERPIPSAEVRLVLKAHLHLVEDGIANLQKAIDIDAHYVDALRYMNLLVRERASLDDTMEQYKSDIEVADDWVGKSVRAINAAAAPEPPLAPASTPAKPRTPSRIRVAGNVQMANLIRSVMPVYPSEAKNAGIDGTVRFQVVISKYGQVQDIQLISGEKALVQAAQDAVRQWMFKPTLLNGEPVEVVTTLDINFTLSQ